MATPDKKAPNPTDKHVGQRIRMRRMMLGKSQEWLGDLLGLTFQQVQKYEKGANRVGASRLQQIAHALGVPVSFFFEGAPAVRGQEPAGPLNSQAVHDADLVARLLEATGGITLAQAFLNIPQAGLRAAIVRLVEQAALAKAVD